MAAYRSPAFLEQLQALQAAHALPETLQELDGTSWTLLGFIGKHWTLGTRSTFQRQVDAALWVLEAFPAQRDPRSLGWMAAAVLGPDLNQSNTGLWADGKDKKRLEDALAQSLSSLSATDQREAAAVAQKALLQKQQVTLIDPGVAARVATEWFNFGMAWLTPEAYTLYSRPKQLFPQEHALAPLLKVACQTVSTGLGLIRQGCVSPGQMARVAMAIPDAKPHPLLARAAPVYRHAWRDLGIQCLLAAQALEARNPTPLRGDDQEAQDAFTVAGLMGLSRARVGTPVDELSLFQQELLPLREVLLQTFQRYPRTVGQLPFANTTPVLNGLVNLSGLVQLLKSEMNSFYLEQSLGALPADGSREIKPRPRL